MGQQKGKHSKLALHELEMASKKPTAPVRDRRLSPSSSPVLRSSATASISGQPCPRAPLAGGTEMPTVAKKSVPNYLKPKASPPSEPPVRKTSSVSPATASSSSKTSTATRPANKPSSPMPTGQTQRQQSLSSRPAKAASMTPMPSSFSKQNGDKAASRVAANIRNSPVAKGKSTMPALIQKRESPATLASPSTPKKLSANHDGERPMQDPLPRDLEKVEESKPTSRWIVAESHLEEQKGCGLELCGESTKQQEVIKEQRVVDKGPTVEVAAAVLRKCVKGKVEKAAEAKVEQGVVRRVEAEARKLRLGVAAPPTVVAATTGNKKEGPRSNDVIEETKSKLMGTRKNRVLALVGAFETVMSLQEPEGQQSQKANPSQNAQRDQQAEQSHGNQLAQPSRDSQTGLQVENGDEVHRIEESKDNGQSAVVEDDKNKPPEENLRQVGGGFEVNQDQQSEENCEEVEGGEVVHQDQPMLENVLHEKDNDEGAVVVLKDEEIDVALESVKAEQKEEEDESEEGRTVNLASHDTNLDLSLAHVVGEIGEN